MNDCISLIRLKVFRDETTYEEMHEEEILGESGLEKADVSEKQGVENEIDFWRKIWIVN